VSSRDRPPFRADHVGSLLRPRELLRARDDLAEGLISGEALREVEDRAIRRAVRMQEDLGLRSATDGELRRSSWHLDFILRLGGVTRDHGGPRVAARRVAGTRSPRSPGLRVTGRLHLAETIFGDELSFLASCTGPAVAKLAIPSPDMVHRCVGPDSIDPGVYPDLEEYSADLAAAYAEEVRRLGALGCRYLQLDDLPLADLDDTGSRPEPAREPQRPHLRYIQQINSALATRPPGMTVTAQVCRGRLRSSSSAEGGDDVVAEAIFNELDVDGFFLAYDDPRPADFSALRFVPPGRMVVLGLVSTERPGLESADDLRRRIDEAARYVPLEQLCLSPRCGFASTVEGTRLGPEDEIAKLRLVVETAESVWG